MNRASSTLFSVVYEYGRLVLVFALQPMHQAACFRQLIGEMGGPAASGVYTIQLFTERCDLIFEPANFPLRHDQFVLKLPGLLLRGPHLFRKRCLSRTL